MSQILSLLKGFARDRFGEEAYSSLKSAYRSVNSARLRAKSANSRVLVAHGTQVEFEIGGDGDFFRGYYDIEYFDPSCGALLCHRLPPGSYGKTNREVKCDVGYYDVCAGEFSVVAQTNAWCWQQGSRLRWHPCGGGIVMFNSVSDEAYSCKILDVESGEELDRIPAALYDVSPDGSFGMSVNFSRLQRLRPGYGYDYLEDSTEGEVAPDSDGLWLVDLEAHELNLVCSLSRLSRGFAGDGEHYINHVSISPDSKHVMFFHIVQGDSRAVRLCVCDPDGSRLEVLEDSAVASHYCWIDGRSLLVTFFDPSSREEYYAVVNTETGEQRVLDCQDLRRDGHPSSLGEGCFVSDTYPDGAFRQHLFTFDLEGGLACERASVFHDPRLVDEFRCDLHPSASIRSGIVTVDSACRGRRRTIIGFRFPDGG